MTVCLLLKGKKKNPNISICIYFIWISCYPSCLWEERKSWRAPHQHVWVSDIPDQKPAGVPAIAKGPAWSAHMLLLYTTDWCQSKAVQMFSVLLHHGQQSANNLNLLYLVTLQTQVLAWSISSPFRHEVPPKSWKSSMLWGSLDRNLGLNFSTFQH